MACFNEEKSVSNPLGISWEFWFIAQSVRNAYFWCYHCYSREQLFERVSNLSVLLITIQFVQIWYNETYRWGQNGTGCAVLPFPIYQEYIFAYISWFNTCIVIDSAFLPNIMIISWIFSTWDQFFFSYAILPQLPLPFIFPFGIVTATRSDYWV